MVEAQKVTYTYLAHEFEGTTDEPKSVIIQRAIDIAFPGEGGFPDHIPERDGGGFRVYKSAPGPEFRQTKLQDADAVGPGRLADGTLFWPKER